MDQLIHQARLAYARLPYQRGDLAVSGLRLRQGVVQGRQLRLSPDKRGLCVGRGTGRDRC